SDRLAGHLLTRAAVASRSALAEVAGLLFLHLFLRARSFEFKLMQVHADALADEGHAFILKAHLLLESGFAGKADLATRANDAVPGQSAHRAQRPHHLAGGAGESGCGSDLSVGRDFSFRDLQNGGVDLGEHVPSIIEDLTIDL